jgi:NAD(P)-dependent dehydrogenase (short-subunit alcohol dehydrogenase family)
VVLADVNGEAGEGIAEEIRRVPAWPANVAEATDCERLVKAAVERYGRLIARNNAGISGSGT